LERKCVAPVDQLGFILKGQPVGELGGGEDGTGCVGFGDDGGGGGAEGGKVAVEEAAAEVEYPKRKVGGAGAEEGEEANVVVLVEGSTGG
jgi:hypothetical protein